MRSQQEERMAEERKCCNCAIGLICDECNEDNSKWQPIAQEKLMEKIQMTEEQARELFSVIGLVETIDIAIDESKKHGYIRKSAVGEAEEMYKEWLNRIGDMSETVVMDKMYLAIQEQKKENVRLSNLIRDSRE
jgi:hypothetical protein